MMREGQRTPACMVTPSSNRGSAIAFNANHFLMDHHNATSGYSSCV
jgi:hypothetical protein